MASPVSEQTPTTKKARKTYTDLVAILSKDLNHDQLKTLSKRVKEAVQNGFIFSRAVRLKLLDCRTDERLKETIRMLDDQVI